MRPIDPEKITKEAIEVVKETGKYIQQQAGSIERNNVKDKSFNNFVTTVDTEAEQRLVKGLKEILPEAGYITEEKTTKQTKGNLAWIIDPIDGTTNFIHNIPCYSVSVALMNKGEILSGIVYEINFDECFYAWKDSKAFLNSDEIKVTQTDDLEDSLIATGFPYDDFQLMDEYMDLLRELMFNSRGIRRLGSAAVDLAYVACGRFDCFYEYGLHPWDVAGGAFIVQQAGGLVNDFSGGQDYLFGKEIIACNNFVHAQLLEVIKKKFRR